jgi:hypothetical protein
MTPDEISAWKAEQAKKPLSERLATIPGHQVETPAQVGTTPTQAEVGWNGKAISDSKDDTSAD